MSTLQTVPNKSAKLVPFPAERVVLEDFAQSREQLALRLQRTLELEEQANLLFDWLHSNLTIDGIHYQQQEQRAEIKIGSDMRHQCHYHLTNGETDLGELSISRRQAFAESELRDIENALATLIFPLKNALQYRAAVQTALIDPLTGTGNRIALDNALHRELQMAERYRQDLSLLMIDIDHFKNINDTHGHATGDAVLQKVAATIREITRQTDMTFRYGGEEFVVVLSKTELSGAHIIAQRIRQSIANLDIDIDGQNIGVTVSLGLSSLRPNEHIKSLFDRADKALYKAKNSGRNQVVCEEEVSEAI